MRAITFSKQWIHFFRSDLWPPTSTILPEWPPFQSSGLSGTPQRGTPDPVTGSKNRGQPGAHTSCALLSRFTPTGRYHYYTRCTDEETEAQRRGDFPELPRLWAA